MREGSIPAWAGKPLCSCARGPGSTVYPRVGGETGTPVVADHSRYGLSPRGRGNPSQPVPKHPGRGSIPAWAGKPTA